ncbi:MAG: hypothetical protein U0X20_06630 [Caldilineaceae bacterium]
MALSTDPEKVLAMLKRECPKVVIDGVTYWVVESDLLYGEQDLVDYAVRRAAAAAAAEENSAANAKKGLLAKTSGGRMLRWAKGKILTYRVDYASFQGNDQEYAQVVAAAHQATADWQAACCVTFQHLDALDKGVPAGTAPPLFAFYRNWDPGNLLALAFFPDSPLDQRRVFVYNGFFKPPSNPYGQAGVLRHELGHVLGFRHEHIRAESPPTCRQGRLVEGATDAQPLTPYDHQSVMHYICPNANMPRVEWVLTDYDKKGAQVLYGTPDGKGAAADHLVRYIP